MPAGGCGCSRKGANGQPMLNRVKMPSGEIKTYSSPIAAAAMVEQTEGAVLLPQAGASV